MMTIESEYIYSFSSSYSSPLLPLTINPIIYHNDILNFNVFSKVSGLIEC